MKRPLVPVALAYVGGLLLAEFFQPPLGLLFVLAIGTALAALLLATCRKCLIWPLLIFTGWTNSIMRTAIISPDDLRRVLADAPQIVTVRGTLLETPSQRIVVRDEKESARSLALLGVSQVCRGTNWAPATGHVLVLTPGILDKDYYAGQVVDISGVLGYPPGALAEGLFDYRAYLRRQGVYFQLKAESPADWRRLSADITPPWGDRFLGWAQTTLAKGLPEQDEPLHLLWAMTLGWKTGMTNEIYEPFMRSGTMHIFAISGLHIALIAGILASLLRVARISRAWCGLIIVPLIWFYTGATGWQPSAIRSTIMMSIIIAGWSLRRPSDLINSLAAAAFIILLWDPQQLFGASFQLSFFVVLSIALLLPPLERARERLLQTDPLLPAELVPRWQRWLRTFLRWVSVSLATSLAAWLGSLPLTAYYFHLFSPVTLLANLVIVPLSSFALAANLGSLVCGDWFPWATVLFNFSGWWWMQCMVQLSHWSTLLPNAYVYVRCPTAIDFLVYYALLIGTLSGWLLAPRRCYWALTALVATASFYGWQAQSARHRVTLTVLPLSGGMAVFTDAPGTKDDLLIDCGSSNSVEFVTRPFLRGQGVNHLPGLVLTHGDVRHIGGAEMTAELFSVRQVCASPIRFRSPGYRRALQQFKRTPGKVRTLKRSDSIGPWTVLHPEPSDHFAQADDNALVLKGSFYGTRVLLLSNLGREGQKALLERNPDLRADIVVSGLPSAGEPLCEALLAAVKPKLIIVADSEFPATERASARFRERLAQSKISTIYTRSALATRIELRDGDWAAQTVSGLKFTSETRAILGKGRDRRLPLKATP